MKTPTKTLLALALALPALHAQAASYEEGLRYKQQRQLPQATEVFAAVAAREPKNALAREQLAIVLGWQNRFDDSIAAWQQAIALAPGKPDYHVGLARVQYWKGERRAALASLDTALKLAPTSTEALKLRGDVLLADAQPAAARQSYLRAQKLDPRDADIDDKLARSAAPLRWRLDAGLTYDRYDNARGSENSRFAQLGRRVGDGGDVVYARYDGYRNFGATDNGLTLGAYWLPHPRLLLNLEAGRTLDEANFRPETQLLVSGEWLLEAPVQPLLGYRYLRYGNGTVATITPGLRALLPGATAEVRYGVTDNLDGSSTGVFAARVSFERESYAPYLAFTSGSEALPPQAEADITVLGAGLVLDLTRQWGARVDYNYEDRKDIYKHHALGAGLTYRF